MFTFLKLFRSLSVSVLGFKSFVYLEIYNESKYVNLSIEKQKCTHGIVKRSNTCNIRNQSDSIRPASIKFRVKSNYFVGARTKE